MPPLLKAAAEETLRGTSAIEAVLLYGSRAKGTHREDSDYDIAVVTKLEREEGLEAAKPLQEEQLVEKHWTQIVCRASGEIERYANTAGTLESRLAREAILIAGDWTRPACTQGTELEIDAEQALTWARIAVDNAMWATGWLEDASRESWERDNEAGGKVQRMMEQTTKGILATFGVYESDIHDLDGTADELENAYSKSQWMKDERAEFAAMVRGLKARGRAALRAEKHEEPLEPLDDTIERLGAAFDLLLGWLRLVVRLHPEVKEDVVDIATTVGRLDRGTKEERVRVTASFRKLAEHMHRTGTQARMLAGQ